MSHQLEIVATVCFALAVLHTFSVKPLQHLARQFPEGSVGENFFHLLGEVEVVFGLWSFAFLAIMSVVDHFHAPVEYLESLNFTEPAFVFVIMSICSTKPILETAGKVIRTISYLIPVHPSVAFYASCLIVGPLLGSFVTEPAAMTVTALILLDHFYRHNISTKLKYATIGLLFVNVSIGGTLTHFAAPPVLMVAGKFGWDLPFMLTHFGWKALIAVVLNTAIVAYRFRNELKEIKLALKQEDQVHNPIWANVVHLFPLAAVVMFSHHLVVFVGFFMFFLGMAQVMKEYHGKLSLREPLLVAFFLGGLVIIGTPQRWWLEPVLRSLNDLTLYSGAAALTAITDNAALTYLGSQVPDLSELSKYALVAGSVVGGGMTVIANAPNPAGYGILNRSFGPEGISAKSLALSATIPTLIAYVAFWFL